MILDAEPEKRNSSNGSRLPRCSFRVKSATAAKLYNFQRFRLRYKAVTFKQRQNRQRPSARTKVWLVFYRISPGIILLIDTGPAPAQSPVLHPLPTPTRVRGQLPSGTPPAPPPPRPPRLPWRFFP